MTDYLQRNQAPLTGDQWAELDRIVVQTAQSALVGRRFLTLVGPFGPGVEVIPNDTIQGANEGQLDLLGNVEDEAIGISQRGFLPLPLIYKDFWIHWRDLEATNQVGLPLDAGRAAAAASAAAQAEDRLIFDGNEGLGLPGLRNAPGRQTLPMGSWDERGGAFSDAVNGIRALVEAGFTGPYALAVSPRLYAELNRVFDATGVLELEQVEKLARRGVYQTAILPDPSAILVDSGAGSMDLAVGLDLATAYVESSNLNHHFRVLESLVLRIRRPGAICTFEPSGERDRRARGGRQGG